MSPQPRQRRGIESAAIAALLAMHATACCTTSVGPRLSDSLAAKRFAFAGDEQPLARECIDGINAQRGHMLSIEAHRAARLQWSGLTFTGLTAGAAGLSVAAGNDPGWDGKEAILATTLVLTVATGIHTLISLVGGADTTSYTSRQEQLKIALSKPGDADKVKRTNALASCITGQ